MTPDDAERAAREYLSGKRLEHSLSVASLAAGLGAALGEDEEALFVAGALHDIAKQLSPEEQRDLAERWHIEEGGAPLSRNPALWHAPAAAWIILYKIGLSDRRISAAAARHTTGCREMSRFDECLYIADFLDPVRRFAAQDSVWPLIETDFDEALLAVCRLTIASVLERRNFLDSASLEYYNELVERLGRPDRQIQTVRSHRR